MIQSEELRRGNLVYIKIFDTVVPIKIVWIKQNELGTDDEYEGMKYELEEVFPIPIADISLENLGFIHKAGREGYNWTHGESGIKIQKIITSLLRSNTHINLQNLYYALTGKELIKT